MDAIRRIANDRFSRWTTRLALPLLAAFVSASCASVRTATGTPQTEGVAEFADLDLLGANRAIVADGELTPILSTRSRLLIDAESGDIGLSCSPGADFVGELWHAEFGIVPLRRTDDGQLLQMRPEDTSTQ